MLMPIYVGWGIRAHRCRRSSSGRTSWALAALHERTDVHLLALEEHTVDLRRSGKRQLNTRNTDAWLQTVQRGAHAPCA